MSKSVEAPNQFKQPSRKGKKAWRKNVDVTEVQEGLRQLKDEEIKGYVFILSFFYLGLLQDHLLISYSGLVSEKPSDELFILDTTGNEDVRRQISKKHKPLKADEIIAQRSLIPALDGRKRVNSNVTDGVIEPKTKKHKKDWVSNKELQRLKQVAQDGTPTTKIHGSDIYDPWAEDAEATASAVVDDPRFDFLVKPKAKVAPETIKHAPVSLAANGKRIPSVRTPQGGHSYNPVFEEWDRLLEEQGAAAVEAEKKRLEEEKKDEEKRRMQEAAQGDDGEVKSDDESAWEGFESEYEKPEWLNKKRPERKSKTQRNKINRRKEAERLAKWEAKKAATEKQAEQVELLAEEARQRAINTANDSDADDDEEGDDTQLRRRAFGGKLAYVLHYFVSV